MKNILDKISSGRNLFPEGTQEQKVFEIGIKLGNSLGDKLDQAIDRFFNILKQE